MLVLARHRHESILIILPDNQIVKVKVNKFDSNQVSLAFEAPNNIIIVREEVYDPEKVVNARKN